MEVGELKEHLKRELAAGNLQAMSILSDGFEEHGNPSCHLMRAVHSAFVEGRTTDENLLLVDELCQKDDLDGLLFGILGLSCHKEATEDRFPATYLRRTYTFSPSTGRPHHFAVDEYIGNGKRVISSYWRENTSLYLEADEENTPNKKAIYNNQIPGTGIRINFEGQYGLHSLSKLKNSLLQEQIFWGGSVGVMGSPIDNLGVSGSGTIPFYQWMNNIPVGT